ncbi:uncharacterized protein LOC144444608 [Glandiceps talaboti]
MSGKVIVNVRYAEGNQMPITCEDTDTILNLANLIKHNANLFGLNSDDIKLHDVCLHVIDKSGKKTKLELVDHISKISRGCTVEFRTQPDDLFEIPVRYLQSVNPIWLPCRKNNTVADLAHYIQENIDSFHLSAEVSEEAQRRGSEIVILQTKGGETKQVNPLLSVQDLANDKTLAFKINSGSKPINPGLEFLVRYETSLQPLRFRCTDEENVAELISQIRKRMGEFRLADEDAEQAKQRTTEIVLRTVASKSGDKSKVLDPCEDLVKVKTKKLEFSFQSLAMRTVTLDDIEAKCVNQNIAFISMPGHGKSSSINTIIKALTRLHHPLASTWSGAATGTAVISPYSFDLHGKKFRCVDVPGATLAECQSKDDKEHTKLKKVLGSVVDGEVPAHEPLNYWAWYSPASMFKYSFKKRCGPIHAIVYVHKGVAQPDKLGSVVIQVAQKRGRGIPVFGLVTHIDKMTEEAIEKSVDDISIAYGIDKARVFRIANLDHQQGESRASMTAESKDTANYVQQSLLAILSAAENYMTGGIVTVK